MDMLRRGGAGVGVVARENRAGRPGQRSANQCESTYGVDALRIAQVLRTHEQGHAGKAEEEAGHDAGGRAESAGAEPVHQDHPEGYGGHQERGNAGGDSLLCPGDCAVAYAEEQAAHNEGGAPLGPGRLLAGG